ncbi:unnamed protein product [Rotaria sordida]|uniref:Myosin VI lever arm domain-containing protein n=1 Tax=Rotaria sordida TaxID=392033 RepID=A0A815U7W2_9BILA|nr:unnamed protein product [Rotaria sordida]CAF1510377.1 unnamed protein product [Rotaria sordida]
MPPVHYVTIPKVEKRVLWARWKKAQWCVLSVIKLTNKILYRRQCLIEIQKRVRMRLVYKRHAPRIRGLIKVKALLEQVASMENIVGQMKVNKEQVYKQVHQLRQQIDQLINEITNTSISETNIDDACDDLVSCIGHEFRRLQQALDDQVTKEEEEVVKKIAMELEREKNKILAIEIRLEQEKEEFRQCSAIAQRQKAEEQFQGKLTAEETKCQKEHQAKESDEEPHLAELNERERCDYDIARRLALETGDKADLPHLIRTRRPVSVQKYDLSKYTYHQLRDLISTSCDFELLEAYQEELHLRLKTYERWLSKDENTKNPSAPDNNIDEDEERDPKDILNNGKFNPVI